MDASFSKNGPRYTLLFERHLSHPPEKVWRVLTERELLRQWFPCDVEGEWKVGAPLRFTFLHGEGEGLPEDVMRGEVLKVEPPRELEFRWGEHYYRCELIAEGDGCRLIFSDSFDAGSEGARNAAGWEACLQNLDLILEGGSAVNFVVDAWRNRFEYYAKKFEVIAGPQAGMPDPLAETLANAYALRREGKRGDAYAEFQKVAELCRNQENNSNLIIALKGLGQIERDRNHPSAALPFYVEAETLSRAQSDGLALAHTIRHLADLHQELGNLDSAEPLYQEALAIYRREPSTDDLALANTLRPMALLMELKSRRSDAKAYWQDARLRYLSEGIKDGVAECDQGIHRCS